MLHFFPHPPKPFLKIRCRSVLLLAFLLCSLTVSTVRDARAQGFGRLKMKLTLERKHAPRVYPPGTTLLLQIASLKPTPPDFIDQVHNGFARRLREIDPMVNLVDDRPDTLVSCIIELITSSTHTEERTRTEYKKTGEHTVYNQTTGQYDTVDDYGYVTESYTATIVEGHVSLRYETKDVRAANVLDSATLNPPIGWEGEMGAPTTDTIYSFIAEGVAEAIAQRFRARTEPVEVFLPKGDLKRVSELLQLKMWNSALERLGRISEFKDSEKDAYRLYALGLAYEGLAYDGPDAETTRRFIERASFYHASAVNKKPYEAAFQLAASRASSVRAEYKKIDDAINARRAKLMPANPSAGAFRLDNDAVIGWVKAGLSDDKIRARLERTGSKTFDLSADGVDKLLAAGVSAKIVDAMRNSARSRAARSPVRRYTIAFVASLLLQYLPLLLSW